MKLWAIEVRPSRGKPYINQRTVRARKRDAEDAYIDLDDEAMAEIDEALQDNKHG